MEEVVSLRIKRSPKVIAVAAVVGLIAAGGAFAYWSAAGAGTGTAATASGSEALVVTQDLTTLTPGVARPGPLAPGVTMDLGGYITNPNPGSVSIGSIAASIGSVDPATCDASNYTIGGGPAFDYSIIPGKSQIQWYGYTLTMKDLPNVNQDSCKNAVVHVNYTVTP